MDLKAIYHLVYEIFVGASILVMLWGFLDTIYKIIVRKSGISVGEAIRNSFDKSVLFGLQLLIVADIIETIIAPDIQHVLQTFAVVIIRTILSISLQYEMKNHH